MNARLPRLLHFLLLIAAGAWPVMATAASPPPATDVGQGGRLLRQAAAQMCGHRSVKATIRQRADLFGYRLEGKGSYLQVGNNADVRIRLELAIDVDDRPSSLLQINDGRYLWSERRNGDARRVERIDIARVSKQLGKLTGSAAAVPRELLALGGLPELLAALLEHFEFAQPQVDRLGDMPVYRLVGRWRPGRQSRIGLFTGALEESPSGPAQKPSSRVPREVLILLGTDDLFPYVFHYGGGLSDRTDKGWSIGSSRSLLRIELYEVQLDGRIDPRQFVYRPGEVESVDVTRQYLRRLQGPAAQ